MHRGQRVNGRPDACTTGGKVHRAQHHYAGSSSDVRPPDYANDASQNLYFVRGAAAFAAEGVIDGMHLFAPGELERSAFYDEILAPLDVQYSMGLCLHADAVQA